MSTTTRTEARERVAAYLEQRNGIIGESDVIDTVHLTDLLVEDLRALVDDEGYQAGWEQGYADGHADGYSQGSEG